MRFTFGYPHGGVTHYSFTESIYMMLFHEWVEKKREDCLLGSHIEAGSCSVCMNRNKIVNFFMNQTTDDYVFMADTDVAYDRDILTRFNAHIEDRAKQYPIWDRVNYPHIVAGRVDIGTGMPVFYKRTAPGDFKQDPRPFRGLKQFDAVGSGLIVISRYVLQTVYNYTKNANFYMYREEAGKENGVDVLKMASDDFSFQFLVEKYGFKCYGAWDIRGYHQKQQTIQPRYLESPEEFEEFVRDHPDQVPAWLKEDFYKVKE